MRHYLARAAYSVVRLFGAGEVVERAATGQTLAAHVVPDLALWNQAARIGGGLTPAVISSIVREADGGYIDRLVDLANECRQRDCHLQAVLSTSEEAIAGLPWQIVAPDGVKGGKPRLKDRKAAEWVEKTLRENPGVQRLIADLAGALYYSFAVVEIVWRKDGGRLIPDQFRHIAPRRFRFRREDGRLVLCDQGGPEVDVLALHPNKFIHHAPRVNGDVPHREGLLRPLVWMSVMRNWAIGDWLKTGELSWKPWRIATYKKAGVGQKDREDALAVMKQLTTDFAAVVPDSMDVRIEWPGGAVGRSSTHAEICTTLANEMSKAVLGQTETTQSSSSSGYAQAKVHNEVRRDLREARARSIAADITRDLVMPMVRLNFGDTVAIPRFEFITQDPIDLVAFSEALKNLAGDKGVGARIPQAWAFDQMGIPEPKEDEPVLGVIPTEDDESGEADDTEQSPADAEDQDEEEPTEE